MLPSVFALQRSLTGGATRHHDVLKGPHHLPKQTPSERGPRGWPLTRDHTAVHDRKYNCFQPPLGQRVLKFGIRGAPSLGLPCGVGIWCGTVPKTLTFFGMISRSPPLRASVACTCMADLFCPTPSSRHILELPFCGRSEHRISSYEVPPLPGKYQRMQPPFRGGHIYVFRLSNLYLVRSQCSKSNPSCTFLIVLSVSQMGMYGICVSYGFAI